MKSATPTKTQTQRKERTNPLSKTLETFVDAAIADTPTLTTEQILLIKKRLAPLYEYYRPNPPYIVDCLDTLGDTDTIRDLETFFREQIQQYTTGWNKLEYIYCSLQAVYIGYVNEYVRIGQENYQEPTDTETTRITRPPIQTSTPAETEIPLPPSPPETITAQPDLFG